MKMLDPRMLDDVASTCWIRLSGPYCEKVDAFIAQYLLFMRVLTVKRSHIVPQISASQMHRYVGR